MLSLFRAVLLPALYILLGLHQIFSYQFLTTCRFDTECYDRHC